MKNQRVAKVVRQRVAKKIVLQRESPRVGMKTAVLYLRGQKMHRTIEEEFQVKELVTMMKAHINMEEYMDLAQHSEIEMDQENKS